MNLSKKMLLRLLVPLALLLGMNTVGAPAAHADREPCGQDWSYKYGGLTQKYSGWVLMGTDQMSMTWAQFKFTSGDLWEDRACGGQYWEWAASGIRLSSAVWTASPPQIEIVAGGWETLEWPESYADRVGPWLIGYYGLFKQILRPTGVNGSATFSSDAVSSAMPAEYGDSIRLFSNTQLFDQPNGVPALDTNPSAEGGYAIRQNGVQVRQTNPFCQNYPHTANCAAVIGTVNVGDRISPACQKSGQIVGSNPYWVYGTTSNGMTGWIPSWWLAHPDDVLPGVPTCSDVTVRTRLTGIGDVFGNGIQSFVSVKNTGEAILYYGNGTGSYASTISLGGGWQNSTHIAGVGNFGGKGGRGLLQVRDNGDLYLYDIVSSGGYATLAGPGAKVATGFGGVTGLAGVGDIFGNGRQSFVVVSGSQARLYYGNGTGSYASSISLGAGWENTAQVTGVGKFNGVHEGMLQLRKDGTLWLYSIVNSGGNATLAGPGTKVDAGFQGTTELAGVGNFDAVSGNDFVFVSGGVLYRASGTGAGSYREIVKITGGWS